MLLLLLLGVCLSVLSPRLPEAFPQLVRDAVRGRVGGRERQRHLRDGNEQQDAAECEQAVLYHLVAERQYL